MLIKNEKIEQNCSYKYENSSKVEQKNGPADLENEKLEKFFLCEKNFLGNFGTNLFSRTAHQVMLLVLVWAG